MGWWIHLSFKIALHIKDKALLERIKNSLGVWRIYNQDTNYVQLFVQSIEELTKVIEHLEKYSLITKKFADYKLLKQAYNLMFKNEHLKEEGLCKFVDIKTSFNLGGFSPKRLFLKLLQCRDLVLKIKKSQDLNWLVPPCPPPELPLFPSPENQERGKGTGGRGGGPAGPGGDPPLGS